MRRRLVTLMTDIGPVYAAQMKGVLARYVSPDRVVDLAHELPAHRVGEAAFLLRHMAASFPSGTVHVAVVDPGVGGVRAPVAVRCRDGSLLVGPDNGVLYPLAEHLGITRSVRLLPERVRPKGRISATFEGRDLFAPAAGRLARGTPLGRLGTPTALTPFRIPAGRAHPGGASGEVLHIDRFGNVISSLESALAPPIGTMVRVRLGSGRPFRAMMARTYEEIPRSSVALIASSFDRLEISVREGRASDRWRVHVGSAASLEWDPRARTRGSSKALPANLGRPASKDGLPIGLRIREYMPGDHERVVRLWISAGLDLGPSDSRSELTRTIERDPELFLLGERKDRVVGAVLGRFDGRRGWVNHLAVEPRLQSLGIGRALLDELERRLILKGCRKVNLHVIPSNSTARRFYRNLGYRERDLLMMQKEFRAGPRAPPAGSPAAARARARARTPARP